MKNNLLAPVFALFRENRGRDNLINSAVIELVEVREGFIIFPYSEQIRSDQIRSSFGDLQ